MWRVAPRKSQLNLHWPFAKLLFISVHVAHDVTGPHVLVKSPLGTCDAFHSLQFGVKHG